MGKWNFSRQLIIALMILVVISTGLTGLVAYRVARDSHWELTIENLQNLTESTVDLIDASVDASMRNHLRAIVEKDVEWVAAYERQVLSGEKTREEVQGEVERLLKNQTVGGFGYTYVINSSGDLIQHPSYQGRNIAEYDFIQEQITRKEGYLEYEWKNPLDPVARKKIAYMTYYEPWDYIITATVHRSDLAELIRADDFKANILAMDIGESGYVYVMNSQGELIIHPDQEGQSLYQLQDAKGNYFIQDMIKRKNGQVIYPWKSETGQFYQDKMVIFRYYEPLDWYVCSGVTVEEIQSPLVVLRDRLLLVLGIVLIMTLCVALVISSIIVLPIQSLIRAMEAVIEGDYEWSLPEGRHDVMGRMTEIFQQMIVSIRAAMDESDTVKKQLEESNRSLERKVQERTRELEMMSHQDGLTSLFNRRRLDEHLLQMEEYAGSWSVLMIDIDEFKKYNDSYGHLQGDDCLRRVADCIQASLRVSKDFVARYGGEEFCAVLEDVEAGKASDLASRVKDSVEAMEIPHKASTTGRVTVSIGVSSSEDFLHGSGNRLVEAADQALYQAKKNGRNMVWVWKEGGGHKIEIDGKM